VFHGIVILYECMYSGHGRTLFYTTFIDVVECCDFNVIFPNCYRESADLYRDFLTAIIITITV